MEHFPVFLFAELCRFVGSREQVYIHRKWSLFEHKLDKKLRPQPQDENIMIIESGSIAEGLRLRGSDVDYMAVFTDVSVLPTSSVNLYQPNLIMESENVKPGFVRLRATDKVLYSQRYLDHLIRLDISFYLSSALFSGALVKMRQQRDPNTIAHGPCSTDRNYATIDRDVVPCFACKVWPGKASDWIYRDRPHNWPSREFIQDTVSNGCLVVPIGNPNSELKSIEWRISFSMVETKLFYSMNHIQLLCYGLLKLYLKHVIESDEALKGLLCSYFLKTSLFYCIEGENIGWEKENFINCFWTCIRRLLSWVRLGYCPNYFIKDNNMFESKIYGDTQTRLLAHLSNLYSHGLDTFVLIPCLQNVMFRFRGSFHPFGSRGFDVSDTELERLSDTSIFGDTPLPPVTSSGEILLRIYTTSQHVSSSLDRALSKVHIFHCKFLLAQAIYLEYVCNYVSNKDKYKRLKMLQSFILYECTGGDICTGWLQYATLCYITGQYDTVIYIIKHVLKRFNPYTLYKGVGFLMHNGNSYMQTISGRGLTSLENMKLALARTYRVIPSCCLYPCEVESEIIRNAYQGEAFIPPVVYLNVLLFLSYKALGCIDEAQYSLNEIYTAAYNKHFVTDLERPIAMALLARCLQVGNE